MPTPDTDPTSMLGGLQTTERRTVTLKSGGTITISASLDVFKMSPEDRAFVFALIDKLESYESGTA